MVYRQIWIMDTDGGSETQLTFNTDHDVITQAWSPDGEWIAYASNEGEDSRGNRNYDIWPMSKDGGRRTQLTTNGSKDVGPCRDRHGEYIYFLSNRGGKLDIWRFEPILDEAEAVASHDKASTERQRPGEVDRGGRHDSSLHAGAGVTRQRPEARVQSSDPQRALTAGAPFLL